MSARALEIGQSDLRKPRRRGRSRRRSRLAAAILARTGRFRSSWKNKTNAAARRRLIPCFNSLPEILPVETDWRAIRGGALQFAGAGKWRRKVPNGAAASKAERHRDDEPAVCPVHRGAGQRTLDAAALHRLTHGRRVLEAAGESCPLADARRQPRRKGKEGEDKEGEDKEPLKLSIP